MAGLSIPGYYFDPNTRKYYKETDNNDTIKKLKQNVLRKKNFAVNSPIILKHREIGSIHQMQRHYFRSILFAKKQKIKFASSSPRIMKKTKEIEFVKGGENSIFCIYSIENSSEYVLCKVRHQDVTLVHGSVLQKLNTFPLDLSNENISEHDIVVFVDNNLDGEGRLNFWSQVFNEDTFNFECNQFYLDFRGPLFCVDTANKDGCLHIVAGGDSALHYAIRNINSTENSILRKYVITGRTMTTRFDDTKNIILTGQSNGLIYILDVRSNRPSYSGKLQDGLSNCLVDSLYLQAHSNQFIVTSVDNKMFNFDLRVMKPSVEFVGHKTTLRKYPMSFSNNFLCATGTDNVVRFWDHLGGQPLEEMMPPNFEKQQRGWLAPKGSISELYCFEANNITVFKI